MNGWMNLTDPLDDTLTFNQTGLELMMAQKGGSIWGGYLMPWDKFVFGVNVGQKYLMENTTLGIPALIQSEGWYLSRIYGVWRILICLLRFAWIYQQRNNLAISYWIVCVFQYRSSATSCG